jgi:hypothetical protein
MKYQSGDRVFDPISKRCGTILDVKDQLAAIQFDDHLRPLLVHVEDIQPLDNQHGDQL